MMDALLGAAVGSSSLSNGFGRGRSSEAITRSGDPQSNVSQVRPNRGASATDDAAASVAKSSNNAPAMKLANALSSGQPPSDNLPRGSLVDILV